MASAKLVPTVPVPQSVELLLTLDEVWEVLRVLGREIAGGPTAQIYSTLYDTFSKAKGSK